MKGHLNTKKHKQAILRKNLSSKRQQEAMASGPTQDIGRFATPYPDPQPNQPPAHNLFRGARSIDNAWLNEEGDEYELPRMMTDDQNWSSHRAQDLWRDVDTARSYRAPADKLWGFPLDDGDNDSESDESDATECEMPGLAASEFESEEFAPYASKNCQ